MEAPESQVEEKFFIYELGVLNANNEIIIHLQNMSKLAVQNCLSCLFILILLIFLYSKSSEQCSLIHINRMSHSLSFILHLTF